MSWWIGIIRGLLTEKYVALMRIWNLDLGAVGKCYN